MIYLRYSFAEGYSPETPPESTEEGMRAFRRIMVQVAWHTNPLLVPLIWLLTRWVVRELTPRYIEYRFPLIPSE